MSKVTQFPNVAKRPPKDWNPFDTIYRLAESQESLLRQTLESGYSLTAEELGVCIQGLQVIKNYARQTELALRAGGAIQ